MSGTAPRWHAALAYAVLGRVPAELTEPGAVELELLLHELGASEPGGLDGIATGLAERGVRRLPAYGVPDELRIGLPAAQLAAALTTLQERLGLGRTTRITAARPLDADERRLQADVPPHHGV